MEILFLGVGEACDERYPNTSILVKGGDSNRILLDCGFTTPHQYFAYCSDADELDALWISHFHGDHFFGVPLLLLRFWEMGRSRPLKIIGRPGIEERISAAMDLAYSTLSSRFAFDIDYIEMESGSSIEAAEYNWRTAENDHSSPCLAVRLERDGKSVFYSGDGRPTPATLELARGCDLVIHEAFQVSGDTPGHGSVSGCLDFAKKAGVANLALLHIQRQERLNHLSEINEQIAKTTGLNVIIPEPGDIFRIE